VVASESTCIGKLVGARLSIVGRSIGARLPARMNNDSTSSGAATVTGSVSAYTR